MKLPRTNIEGHVSAGFEAVRDAFAENFSRRQEFGGACCAFGNGGSFGMPGTGGSLGFADPKAGIGYAYVTNRMGTADRRPARSRAAQRAVRYHSTGILDCKVHAMARRARMNVNNSHILCRSYHAFSTGR